MSEQDTKQTGVVVTAKDEIVTEQGTFETFEAPDHVEKSDCMAFFNTDIPRGTVRVEKDILRSVVYL
jgi:hypothetical protein